MLDFVAAPARLSTAVAPRRRLAATTALTTLGALTIAITPQAARADFIDNGSGNVDCTGTFAGYRGILAVPTTVTIEKGATSTGTIDLTGVAPATVNSAGTIATATGPGISIASLDGPITVNATGSISTSGARSAGIFAYSGDYTGVGGNVVVTAGTIATSGFGSTGINAQTYGAGASTTVKADNIVVGNGSIVAGGAAGTGSYGVLAYSQSGAVSVTTGTVATTNASGIFALGGGSTVAVDSGTVTVTGNGTGIIDIAFAGNAAVNNRGSVSVQGDGFFGIYAGGQQGVTITGGGTVATSGVGSRGIFATSPAGDVSITTGTVTTTGAGSRGIEASAPNGAVSITTAAVSTAGDNADAIHATAGKAITVTANGPINTSGAASTGISAFSGTAAGGGGNVSVKAGTIVVSGAGSRGIDAETYGAGASTNVTVAAITASNGAVSGNGTPGSGSYGVLAYSQSGNVSVSSGTIAANNTSGIFALGGGDTVAVDSGTVSVTGDGFGISDIAYAGTATVNNRGGVSVQGDGFFGIYAAGENGVVVTGAGGVRTAGANSTAIYAGSAQGNVSVTSGAIATTGAGSRGIVAVAPTGSVSVNAASVAVSGAGAIGISATGAGAASVKVGNATALDSPAVVVTSTDGAASATLTGITGTGSGYAVTVNGATTASLSLGSGASLGGAGALLTSASGSTVTNAGTITGAETSPVITAVGGPLAFVNAGTFTGTIGFTAGNDSVVNQGTYRLIATQDFGAGTDSFANAGTLLAAPGTTAPATLALTNLERFTNIGIVDLRNGHAGDTLAISGTLSGSGASALGLDVAFAPNGASTTADQLVVGGAITGSTTLALSIVGGNGAVLDPGTVFATGGAGSSATAFTVAPGTADLGLVHLTVAYNPANNSYALVGTPGDPVFRALKINEGAQQLWYASADAWSAHMADVEDARFTGATASGGKVWGQIYGSAVSRRQVSDFSAFGQTRAVDLSYKQDMFGAQIGADVAGGGNVVFGITGGYVNSALTFRGSPNRTTFDAANVGAYARIASGAFFLDVLGKYDRLWARSRSLVGGYDRTFHGFSYGASGEAGVRLGSQSFYLEPLASLAYVRTDLNSLAIQNQTIDFDGLNGLRGKAGARVAIKSMMPGGATGLFYLQASYVHEFDGKDGIVFMSGGQSLGYDNQLIPDRGEAKLGVNIATLSGITGFIEGFGTVAAHRAYTGGGARGGLRVAF